MELEELETLAVSELLDEAVSELDEEDSGAELDETDDEDEETELDDSSDEVEDAADEIEDAELETEDEDSADEMLELETDDELNELLGDEETIGVLVACKDELDEEELEITPPPTSVDELLEDETEEVETLCPPLLDADVAGAPQTPLVLFQSPFEIFTQ